MRGGNVGRKVFSYIGSFRPEILVCGLPGLQFG